MQRNSSSGPAPPRIRDNEWIVGHLVEHGPAKYQFEETSSLSYFVRLRTQDEDGERVLWGADLKRAIREAKSPIKVGRVVAARLVGREPVNFSRAGQNPTAEEIPKYRNRWEIETPQFIAERQKTARQILDNPIDARRTGQRNPEMTGLYLILRGAELIAQNRFPNPEDQKKFVARVRDVLTVTPERAIPILREIAKAQEAQRLQQKAPVREPLVRE
jgi:hypothetical protein